MNFVLQGLGCKQKEDVAKKKYSSLLLTSLQKYNILLQLIGLKHVNRTTYRSTDMTKCKITINEQVPYLMCFSVLP